MTNYLTPATQKRTDWFYLAHSFSGFHPRSAGSKAESARREAWWGKVVPCHIGRKQREREEGDEYTAFQVRAPGTGPPNKALLPWVTLLAGNLDLNCSSHDDLEKSCYSSQFQRLGTAYWKRLKLPFVLYSATGIYYWERPGNIFKTLKQVVNCEFKVQCTFTGSFLRNASRGCLLGKFSGFPIQYALPGNSNS